MRNLLLVNTVILLLIISACSDDNEKKSWLKLTQAIELYHQGQQEKADKLIDEAIELDENNFEAYFYKAASILNDEKYKDGIDFLNFAIDKFPDYGILYKQRAEAKSILDDRNGACQDWKKAHDLGVENLSDRLRHCK